MIRGGVDMLAGLFTGQTSRDASDDRAHRRSDRTGDSPGHRACRGSACGRADADLHGMRSGLFGDRVRVTVAARGNIYAIHGFG